MEESDTCGSEREGERGNVGSDEGGGGDTLQDGIAFAERDGPELSYCSIVKVLDSERRNT